MHSATYPLLRTLCANPFVLCVALTTACSNLEHEPSIAESSKRATPTPVLADSNPLTDPSLHPFNYPQFDRIKASDFIPALEFAMEQQLARIDDIVEQKEAPTIANTLIPLERSSDQLWRVRLVLLGLMQAHADEALGAISAEIEPRISRHFDGILLNEALFERVRAIYLQRESLNLDAQDTRFVELIYGRFVRSGVELQGKQKERLKDINAELAGLGTRFQQNLLSEMNELAIVVDSVDELAGLGDDEIAVAAKAASDRGLDRKYVIPLLRPTQQPILARLENRSLRKRIFEASISRGNRGGSFDNREVLSRTAKLRAERAKLFGFENHATYMLETRAARTVEAVNGVLGSLTPPAVANARREAQELQEFIDDSGNDFQLEAWDWDFYSEMIRRERYDFDQSQLQPYFELETVLKKGVFYAAEQLYGVRVKERFDLPVYHDDVRVFDLLDRGGDALALFILDVYARPSKGSGAWSHPYVVQPELGTRRTVGSNNLNISKPPQGRPTLLTYDEVETLFHEFGHTLRDSFTDIRYSAFYDPSSPADFDEYPSQANEMWMAWPEVLKNYALHHETGEPMPEELLEKLVEYRRFNQGYAMTEYLAACIIDQALHQLAPEEVPTADELMQFERHSLKEVGAYVSMIPPRYRFTYFGHIIVDYYSAGYYGYIWSEILDADTVNWFKENGGLKRENGQRFRDAILSPGYSKEPMTMFRDFRGRDPDITPLLDRRGLN